MSYITLDDAKQFLGPVYESAYEDAETEIPNEDWLQEDIDAMCAIIDSHITRLYEQTITGTRSLALLKSYAQSLLVRKAYSRFDSANIPDSVQSDHDEAIMRLRDLAKGITFLPDEEQDPRNTGFDVSYNNDNFDNDSSTKTVFTRSNMVGY